jgi:hypothetical protein
MARFSVGRLAGLALVAPGLMLAASQAHAGGGDLLVAPTRVVLDGRRGTEVVLNNIGDQVATYRISAELRRMDADGKLIDVDAPDAKELAAREMVLFAPRRVTLPPNQPQSIRLSARAPEGLPDGEYRVHLLFRAVPPPQPAAAPQKVEGIAFKLIPIYGVTIPVIVRLGNLEAKAVLSNIRKVTEDGKPAIALDLSRSGDRSTYGEIRVLKAGVSDPIALVRGVAVYTEVGQRSVTVALDPAHAAEATGQVTVQYVEPTDTGPVTIAETTAVLR